MGERKILRKTYSAMRAVLDFYARQGICLPKEPTLRYIPKKFSQDPNAIAIVNLDEASSKEHKLRKHIGYQQIYWRTVHGIELGVDAIKEYYDVNGGEYHRPKEFRQYSEDILLFKPFKDYLDESPAAQGILVHEEWHLIELNAGVLSKNPFLVEGTATYAEKKFSEEMADGATANYNYAELNEHLLYEDVSNLIGRNMQNNAYGLKALFRQGFRDKLERKTCTMIARHMRENYTYSEEIADLLGIKPLLKVLRKYKASCLAAIRDEGATKLADELERYDLEKILKKPA